MTLAPLAMMIPALGAVSRSQASPGPRGISFPVPGRLPARAGQEGETSSVLAGGPSAPWSRQWLKQLTLGRGL